MREGADASAGGRHGDRTSHTRGRWLAGHVRSVMASTRRRNPPAIHVGEHRVPFQLRNGLIYIQGPVNGMRATCLSIRDAALTTSTLRVVSNAQHGFTHYDQHGQRKCVGFPAPRRVHSRRSGKRNRPAHQSAVVGDFNFCTQMASSERTFWVIQIRNV